MSATGVDTCRLLVVGTHRNRISKIAELLRNLSHDFAGVSIQFLPCVAKFDSYKSEQGELIKYLASLDFYGERVEMTTPQSLVEYFDQDTATSADECLVTFGGVMGVLFTGAIEVDDTGKIKKLVETLTTRPVAFESLKPSAEFSSMQEELVAYRNLDVDSKADVTKNGTMGPAKAATYATNLAQAIINNVMEERTKREPPSTVDLEENSSEPLTRVAFAEVDVDRIHYSCRKCRRPLFGEVDLEDPAHEVGQHQFSYRKINHGGASNLDRPCQSFFLKDVLEWMQTSADSEGKFGCFHCGSKLGGFNWGGAQCSCGTWVVPAIQVPKSKVDIVLPRSKLMMPPGTIEPRPST